MVSSISSTFSHHHGLTLDSIRTYFEDHSAYQYHEAITRWATLLPKIPATIIINCDNNAWGRDSLPKAYARWGANGINLEAGLRAGPYAGKVWGAIGDGIHNTTRYGDDVLVTKKRRDSLGVVFRNWHPGPLVSCLISVALTCSL